MLDAPRRHAVADAPRVDAAIVQRGPQFVDGILADRQHDPVDAVDHPRPRRDRRRAAPHCRHRSTRRSADTTISTGQSRSARNRSGRSWSSTPGANTGAALDRRRAYSSRGQVFDDVGAVVIAVPVDHDDMRGIVAGSAQRIPRRRSRAPGRIPRAGPATRRRRTSRAFGGREPGGEDDIVGALSQDRVDGRALPESHTHVELRELPDSPFDDAVELLTPRIAHDESQLTTERRFALEERDVVAPRRPRPPRPRGRRVRRRPRRHGVVLRPDSSSRSPTRLRDRRPRSAGTRCGRRSRLRMRHPCPAPIHTRTSADTTVRAFSGSSGSAMLARVIATMSTSPLAMIASACSGDTTRPGAHHDDRRQGRA